MIKKTGPESYTATIAGVEWSSITPASHMWATVQQMIADGAAVLDLTAPPTPAQALAAARDAAFLPKADFCVGLVALGILTADDAVFAARGNWPQAMAGFLDFLTSAQAAEVQIEWATRVTVRRTNAFVLILASWAGIPDAQVDALFGIAPAI